MKLFLCSHFSSVGSLIKEEIENKKVAFIPTASLREGYTGYVGSARKLFKKLRAIVTEIDISTEAYSTIQSVFEEADVIYFTTDQKREYEVFAVMSVNIKEFEYWKFVMARDEKDYDEFVEKVLEHSMWNTGEKLQYGKQMLMLSTCDNGKGDDWRIVVVGKEI